MAELIDKQTVIKAVAENMALGYFSKVVNTVAELPTTTESEIRAKAIEEFAERLSDAYSEHSTKIRLHGVDFDILTVDGAIEIMWDLVTEQLKEK